MTFPELLSGSERTSGPLTRCFQQNGIGLPTVDHTEGGQANVVKILQLCQWHGSMYCTTCSVHVRQSVICILHCAICILHWCACVFTVYCTVGSFDDHVHHGTNIKGSYQALSFGGKILGPILYAK